MKFQPPENKFFTLDLYDAKYHNRLLLLFGFYSSIEFGMKSPIFLYPCWRDRRREHNQIMVRKFIKNTLLLKIVVKHTKHHLSKYVSAVLWSYLLLLRQDFISFMIYLVHTLLFMASVHFTLIFPWLIKVSVSDLRHSANVNCATENKNAKIRLCLPSHNSIISTIYENKIHKYFLISTLAS